MAADVNAVPAPQSGASAPAISPVTDAEVAELAARKLLIPVDGVKAAQLQDTYTQSRSNGRLHEAIDIMAPAGTPVRAVENGRIVKLFNSAAGGITVYQFDPASQYGYYYAHLQGYAERLQEGQEVRRGDVIGYVGSTGLATGPHLHYEFRVNGVHMNPLKMTLPPPEPLNGAALAAFKNETRRALDKIREVEDVVFQLDDGSRVASVQSSVPGKAKRGRKG